MRATLIYGANNPVDGAVLEVILRKAEKIREKLGVPVPLPDDSHALTQALMRAVMLRERSMGRQQLLDFDRHPKDTAIDDRWQEAADKAERNKTVFAQRRIKPEEVLPEWSKSLSAVGGRDDVQRFTERALARLGSGLEKLRKGYKAPLAPLPADVRERLDAEGIAGTLLIDFGTRPPPVAIRFSGVHPLVSIMAETLLERTLARDGDSASDPAVLGRVGCWMPPAVSTRTVVVLMRLRHQLSTQRPQGSTTLLVEEATALAWTGASSTVARTVPKHWHC